MKIHAVPCLRDNYAYVIAVDQRAFVIDPSEAAPVKAKLDSEGLELVAILNTHHHWDHVGGNEQLLGEFPGIAVYAHASDRERVPGQTVGVEHDQVFEVAGVSIRVLHVPGHTTGAVTYCFDGAAFTGDTLFIGGCGRLFEGTPAMMHASLCDQLGGLDPATRVYCGHEYTASNLRFALTVEPDNARVRDKLAWAQEQEKLGVPTVPSTIEDELATNPFLRCHVPAVAARYGDGTPVAVLTAIRAAKDVF